VSPWSVFAPGTRTHCLGYFGASLASLTDLFARFSYRLTCCNSQTGANAFFIDDAYADVFADVPTDIDRIYVEPRYFLHDSHGHPVSTRTIETIIKGRPDSRSGG
jgi:hypothetical protein